MAYSTFEQVTLSWRGIVASCNQSRNGGKRTRTREISRTSDFGSRLLSFIPFRRSESLQIPVRPWVQHHETYTRHRHNGTHTGPRWWSRCSKVSERWRRSFVRCFFRPSVGRSVRPSVRPSIRWFVRWYWPCNWAQTLSSARPAKDYTPACPEGPEPNVPVWYIMLQIPVSDSRGEAGVNGVTFSVVLKARCRQRVPWSKRCNGPIIDKQITRRRSTWIKQPPPPPLQIKWSLRWPISFARDLSVTPWLVDLLLARCRIRVMRFWDWFARTGLLILTSQMVNTSSWLRSFII